PDIPLILDPVLSSGRGDAFATEEMIDAMRSLLVSQTTLIAPNSIEARYLALDEHEEGTLAHCAERILDMGAEYVLITGTHENSPQVVNTLYGDSGILRVDSWERLPHSYHGSGCTLASAIAAAIAMGLDVETAVEKAQEYTWNTLDAGFRPGMGQHLPDRFFWAREET
ncbi:MAG TPA: bifunctional hydroxymethylpyrimidine kinase/phosphomethylpyrimidine kinase, partial [Burkholderiales bacterium]|nr:bifunctional hydroxymethylpyrimidine kinase/phosphomethylpyrimidine kinase [Burkholderiales bacterium]